MMPLADASPFCRRFGDIECFAMQYPRLFTRLRPAGRVSSAAKLLAPNATVIPCVLIDYSPGGACLQFDKQIDVPERFEVLYGTTRKHCRLVWKRGFRIGVAF